VTIQWKSEGFGREQIIWKADWSEAEHPRDPDGRFGDGNGNSREWSNDDQARFDAALNSWFRRGPNAGGTVSEENMRVMTDAVERRGSIANEELYRGIGVSDPQAVLDQFKVGTTFDMPASSFTPQVDLALRYTDAQWAEGEHPIIFVGLSPRNGGTMALELESPYPGEPESVVAGRYEVVKIDTFETSVRASMWGEPKPRSGYQIWIKVAK